MLYHQLNKREWGLECMKYLNPLLDICSVYLDLNPVFIFMKCEHIEPSIMMALLKALSCLDLSSAAVTSQDYPQSECYLILKQISVLLRVMKC